MQDKEYPAVLRTEVLHFRHSKSISNAYLLPFKRGLLESAMQLSILRPKSLRQPTAPPAVEGEKPVEPLKAGEILSVPSELALQWGLTLAPTSGGGGGGSTAAT